MYETLRRRTTHAYLIGSTAVLVSGAGIAYLYYRPGLTDLLLGAIVVLLAIVPLSLTNWLVVHRHLAPLRRYFAARQPSSADASAAYATLLRWPLLCARRVMGPHLLTLIGALVLGFHAVHRWLGFTIAPADLVYILAFLPVNVALHAVIEYLLATRNAHDLLQHLRYHHGDELAAVPRARVPFLVKVLVVLFALGFLPACQVVIIALMKVQGLGTTPDLSHMPALVAWMLLTGAAFVIVGAVLLTRDVVRPATVVARAMAAVKNGRLDVRVDVSAWDEMGALAEGFNSMTASLAEQHARIQRQYRGTVRALAAAIDARDSYTRGHSDRVGEYARRMALELGWSYDEADELALTGALHDIGKIGVPEAVLQKNGPLDETEWAYMRRHPVIGYEIAMKVTDLLPHLSGIRHHHERLDGTGYPDGLAGEQIDMASRILAVADVWDALTSDRPYRPAMPLPKATSILLEEQSRNHLDSRVVSALLSLLERGELADLLDGARTIAPSEAQSTLRSDLTLQ
jgi:HD-GYP domain-containing protein (c-di-GMP phosphodiesterase class II)